MDYVESPERVSSVKKHWGKWENCWAFIPVKVMEVVYARGFVSHVVEVSLESGFLQQLVGHLCQVDPNDSEGISEEL